MICQYQIDICQYDLSTSNSSLPFKNRGAEVSYLDFRFFGT